jgi:hypothetical protein
MNESRVLAEWPRNHARNFGFGLWIYDWVGATMGRSKCNVSSETAISHPDLPPHEPSELRDLLNGYPTQGEHIRHPWAPSRKVILSQDGRFRYLQALFAPKPEKL